MSNTKNRFQEFFESPGYTELKNSLYNYRLRRRRVVRRLRGATGRTLEVGCGISPMMSGSDSVVYTDLSFSAIHALRRHMSKGVYIVADAARLPFNSNVFHNIVCSEVLEHLQDDTGCIGELRRVLVSGGRLVVTFPHRRCYFAVDDRYVSHFRRYEFKEMKEILESAGFSIRRVEKVLGPLEKVTMMAVIGAIVWVHQSGPRRWRQTGSRAVPGWLRWLFDLFNRLYAGCVWLDAKVMPRTLASVLLFDSQKF